MAVIGSYPAATSIDGANHFLLIQPGNASTAYNSINRNVLLGVTGQPMDISTAQTVANKVLNNTNTVTVKDGSFTLQDDIDVTKQAQFQLSGNTTSTTRVYSLPNATGTLADIASAQTLTNKSLTNPVITGGSITGTTVITDAIIGQTTATNGTVYGLTITGGKIGNNGVVTNSITAGAVDSTKVATGFAVNNAEAQTATLSTTTTVIPLDDTIPQITEGTEIVTISITPKATTNRLQIDAMIFAASSVSDFISVALFQDTTANALAATNFNVTSANLSVSIPLSYSMSAGTTSSTTFRLRVGPSANTTTITLNGRAGARIYGGVSFCSIKVTEYKV